MRSLQRRSISPSRQDDKGHDGVPPAGCERSNIDVVNFPPRSEAPAARSGKSRLKSVDPARRGRGTPSAAVATERAGEGLPRHLTCDDPPLTCDDPPPAAGLFDASRRALRGLFNEGEQCVCSWLHYLRASTPLSPGCAWAACPARCCVTETGMNDFGLHERSEPLEFGPHGAAPVFSEIGAIVAASVVLGLAFLILS
jgi:hypothetical protein